MTKHCGYILCLVLSIQNIGSALAQAPDSLTLSYDILSEGDDVGDMTRKLSRTEDGYTIVEHHHIKTSGWWGSIDITTILGEEFQHGVGLIKSDSKTMDDGTVYWSRINLHEDEFWGEFTEISKMSKRETQQFFNLSAAATSRDVFKAADIFALSVALFSIRNDLAQAHRIKFVRGSFATTFNDLPFFIQRNAGKPLAKKIQILDPENLEIISVEMTDRGLESILVGSEEIQTRHLIVSNGQFKPSHLWIKIDSASLPYIVRHSGEDEEGTFEMTLKLH